MPFAVLEALKGCMLYGVTHLMRKYTPEQRINAFWSKVNKDGSIPVHCPELGKCWEWTAGTNKQGYGRFRIKQKKYASHHISWNLLCGLIPDGLWVLHKCDNPKCVNPNHLFLGTHQDNMDDMINKKRKASLRGENNPRHILTHKQVLEIRERYAIGGILQRELGIEYGVTQRSISLIVRGEQWK